VPPLLAAGALLRARGHEVDVFRRTPEPDASVAFEHHASAMLATAAGVDVALDVREAVAEARPELVIVDCMLPAGLAAARAADVPTVSLVHFCPGSDPGWAIDLPALTDAHEALGLAPPPDAVAAWEAPDLLLVTAPRWFDDPAADVPPHVVHAGPLAVRTRAAPRSRVLLSFSTTVMEGQVEMVQRVVDGVGVEALLTLGPAIEVGAVRAPPHVEVVPFADHDEVMPSCTAVVTHGGLGTVVRALAHGVPMLLLPLGRDQHANAARVASLGAGIVVDAPADVGSALETLLGDPRFTAAATRAAERIAADEPDRRAAEALERLL
jgi:Erythromycin biosynthesis protein CIII-like, C-terminal domain